MITIVSLPKYPLRNVGKLIYPTLPTSLGCFTLLVYPKSTAEGGERNQAVLYNVIEDSVNMAI